MQARIIAARSITLQETVSMVFHRVYAVIWGSKTYKAHVIDRMTAEGPDFLEHVDVINAVYDGTVLRRRLAPMYSTEWKYTPILGLFASEKEAEAYADKVTTMAEHKTRLHYPTEELVAHVGRRNYTSRRKGLWTRPYPTWKEYIAHAG